jgi:hypothetical protein
MAELEDALPGMMFRSPQDQLRRIDDIQQDIERFASVVRPWFPTSLFGECVPSTHLSADLGRLVQA